MTGEDWIVVSLQASALSRIVCAVLCFVIMGFVRPSHPNYPSVKRGLRVSIGLAGAVLAYNGVDLMYRLSHRPPNPLLSGYLLSAVILALCTSGLLEVLGSWLPAGMRRRIEAWRSLPPCVRREKVWRDRRRALQVAPGTHPPIHDGLSDVLSDTLISRLREAPVSPQR